MPIDGKLTFEVPLSVYPLDAIYAASYVFIDRAFIRLEMTPSQDVLIEMRPKPDVPAKKFENADGEFRNELLHQALRMKISGNNQKIREYLVTQALLSAQPAEETRAPVKTAPKRKK